MTMSPDRQGYSRSVFHHRECTAQLVAEMANGDLHEAIGGKPEKRPLPAACVERADQLLARIQQQVTR